MKSTSIKVTNKIIKTLKAGGVGVLSTDTLYGLVGQAMEKKTISRIYDIKGRDSKKPLIILISSTKDLKIFGVKVDDKIKIKLKEFWPGPVSIIFPCKMEKFKYLHRGAKTLAFRIPKKEELIRIIKKTGPLVAPSANPEGLPPARNITEAKKYFGDNIDFYLKGTKPKNKPSSIIKINNSNINSNIKIIRK